MLQISDFTSALPEDRLAVSRLMFCSGDRQLSGTLATPHFTPVKDRPESNLTTGATRRIRIRDREFSIHFQNNGGAATAADPCTMPPDVLRKMVNGSFRTAAHDADQQAQPPAKIQPVFSPLSSRLFKTC